MRLKDLRGSRSWEGHSALKDHFIATPLAPGTELGYSVPNSSVAMKATSIALLLLITLTANKCVNKAGPDLAAMKEKKWVVVLPNGLRPELPDGAERPWLKLQGDQPC